MTNSHLSIDPTQASKDAWRLFKIVSEFVTGFDTLHEHGPFVSFFGSSRLPPSNPYYKLAYDISSSVAQAGFSILTGAGPSIMEAANKAAQDAQAPSAGLIAELPFEPEPNDYLDTKLSLRYQYFFIRKVMFVRYAQGFVFLPGGFGTMDELFEILNLLVTQKIHPVPIYLAGISYWQGLFDWIKEMMIPTGCLAEESLQLCQFSDDPQEISDGLLRAYKKNAPPT